MENKVKEKKSKGSLVAIIILCVCVLALGGFIGYDKLIKDNSCPKCKETKCTDTKGISYTYQELEGTYNTSLMLDLGDDAYKANYYLTLYKNGTFRYVYSVDIKEGYMGNYIIEGNKIKLNKIFRTGSDIGLTVIEGSKELDINEDKTITESNPPYSEDSGTKTITFTKTDESVDDNFNYMLKQYKIVNEYKGN